jgi:hypothetical protein
MNRTLRAGSILSHRNASFVALVRLDRLIAMSTALVRLFSRIDPIALLVPIAAVPVADQAPALSIPSRRTI